MSFQTRNTFGKQIKIFFFFYEIQELSDLLIDSKGPTTINAQKHIKDIVKIIHETSMV